MSEVPRIACGIICRDVKRGRGRPRAFSPEQVERLRKQLAAGIPIAFLAVEYGVTVSTIQHALRGYPDLGHLQRYLRRRIEASERVGDLWVQKGRQICRDAFHASNCKHAEMLRRT